MSRGALRSEHLEIRPSLRGVFHLIAALAAPFGLVWLLLRSDSPREYVGAAIFASSLIALYATSATYHLIRWPRPFHGIMNRIDHSMIFALIGGTYTPFCIIVLGNGWGIPMLSVVWTLAGLGILFKVAWRTAPRWLGVALYVSLGWVGIVASLEVETRLDVWPLVLLIIGGQLYTVGAIVYALRRPNPYPSVFGFHEIFHLFVIAGSLTHFALVAFYVLPD